MLPDDGRSMDAMTPEFIAVLNKMDKISLRHPHNWDGSVELDVNDESYKRIAAERKGEVCFLLQRNLVVLPDGHVTVCCNDLNRRGIIGSLEEQCLEEIAKSQQRLAMIKAFESGRKDDIAMCRKCTGFYAPPQGG